MVQLSGMLRFLAELAPGGVERWDVTEGDFAWLGGAASVFAAVDEHDHPPIPGSELTSGNRPISAPGLARLRQLDALHSGTNILRLGWVYLVGPVRVGGEVLKVVHPLVERVVVVRPSSFGAHRGREGRFTLHVVGPWDISPWVADEDLAARLEREVDLGGDLTLVGGIPTDEALARRSVERMQSVRSWVREALTAMGVAGATIAPPRDPRDLRDLARPCAVVGFGVHSALDVDRLDLPSSLDAWSTRPVDETALAAAYGGSPTPGPDLRITARDIDDVRASSTSELTVAQARVVLAARAAPLTVVSGPPGTGKTHTATAVALDAVARGESVLIATRSAQAADVVAAHLERAPGPDPVLFGGTTRARRLAQTLADGLAQPGDPEAASRAAASEGREREIVRVVDHTLQGLHAWSRRHLLAAEEPEHRRIAPGWFTDGADLDVADELLQRSEARAGRWWGGRALRRVRRHAGAGGAPSLDRLRAALGAARLRAAALDASPEVGEPRWSELRRAEDQRRRSVAAALREEVRRRATSEHTRAVAALATALRAGRGQRRRHLAGIDGRWLTEALPLWVGTLGDIETLLPQIPAMFDLVVLDEASQIDQPAAAVGLARGRRAVVIGDPRQLRHVSFVPDRDQVGAAERNGVEGLADRLDVRRVSAFDLAASSAAVTLLDEHFRGPPHLIDFSARRFYDGRLTVATRHPARDLDACIDVRPVVGARDRSGVVAEEVAAVVELLAAIASSADGEDGDRSPSLGVVSPFRAQADAVRAAVAATWSAEDIERFHLRVGTVHAFQGDERDIVVVALGVDADGAGLRFVEDPHLFNVLVTRARQRMVVVTACPTPRPGLLRDFLAWAAQPPARTRSASAALAETDPWIAQIADALQASGVPTRVGYAVGRETVDLVVGEGDRAVAVEAVVHPEGPAAHRRRHLRLQRAGWRVVEAHAAAYDGNPFAAAVDLAGTADRPGGGLSRP